MTKVPATITYACVASREKVRIALMITTLNDIESKSGEILNAYIKASVTEKVWPVLGPEFGKDTRKIALIVR